MKTEGGAKARTLNDLKGLGEVSIEKLLKAGITTVSQVAGMTSLALSEVTGLSESQGLRSLTHAKDSCTFQVYTNEELINSRKSIFWVTTGSECLDTLLGGGIESQSVSEFYGAYGSGKSQVCFTSMTEFLINESKKKTNDPEYKPKKVLLIDTENTYRPQRIESLVRLKGQESFLTLVTEGFLIFRPNNVGEQTLFLEKLVEEKMFNTVEATVRVEQLGMIVVDSIISLFRSEYIGLGSLSPRQQKLNSHLKNLSDLAEKYNLACIITNQVSANPDPYQSSELLPVGGNIIGHFSTHRIRLKRYSGGIRTAKMIDSPCLPEEEIKFKIDEGGVRDLVTRKK
jgi:DNA repair protein RadA